MKNEIDAIFERIERERAEALKKIATSDMAEWEKALARKAVESYTFGW